MPSSSTSPPQLSFHEGTLRLSGVTPTALQRVLGSESQSDWVFDDRENVCRADACHYAKVRERLATMLRPPPEDLVFDASMTGRRELQAFRFPHRPDVTLREDQQRSVADWLGAGKRGVIVMPTGTGKTVVAIELIRRCACATLIVVPIRDLMYQWHARLLESTGLDAGLIGDGVHRVEPVSVTTYDSAAIHMPRIGNRFAMIVFDEVHHLSGSWRSDAARMSAACWRLGLTATYPEAPDKRAAIENWIGPVVHCDSIEQARGHTLADYRVHRIAVKLTEAEQRRYRELSKIVQQFVAERRGKDASFRWEQIFSLVAEDAQARRCLRASRLKTRLEERASGKLDVLEDLFRLHADQPVLVFVGSNAMAREISLRFLVPCLLSHCGKRERADLLKGLADGTYPALIANRVLDEGVDLPEVKVAIVIGGTASKRQAIQRLGRVLRKGSGREAVLYEVVTDRTGEVKRSRNRRRNQAYRK